LPEAFICDAVRTPFGRYGGALASVRADDLAAVSLTALMERNPSVDWMKVDDVILGAGMDLAQMDVIELNEAFAARALVVLRELGLPDDALRVNPNGGAIALGHPLGPAAAGWRRRRGNSSARAGASRSARCAWAWGRGLQ
jgi:acetyl-CoA acetyltransferase